MTPKLFLQAVENLVSSFEKNELAYLSVTQKNEHAIRDRIAFLLHRELQALNGYHVCREWRRTDLAILNNGSPALIVEAKAIYSFDAIQKKKSHPYDVYLENDAAKSFKLLAQYPESKECQVLLFLTATHIVGHVSEKYRHIFKYYKDLKKSETASVSDIQEQISQIIDYECISKGVWSAGHVFENEVKVLYWVFKPN